MTFSAFFVSRLDGWIAVPLQSVKKIGGDAKDLSKNLLRLKNIAQLLKEIRDMGIGVIPESKPYHNQVFVGIHKEDLSTDSQCIVARE